MKIACLTSGGLAPCLASTIGGLIEHYHRRFTEFEMIGYLHGYKGLLLGNNISFSPEIKSNAGILHNYGGSPIGNSRVKLSNMKDCIKNGYIKEGEDPIEVAASQLVKDKIDILHTIGGDDTNTTAGELLSYLKNNGHDITIVGLPKTIDNDIIPIQQSLGAWTAAEQGAIFFENISNENTTSSRQLIIHEIMGRHCGWLAAYTAYEYQNRLKKKKFLPEILISQDRWGIDAVYIPEMEINFEQEIRRLKKLMDKKDCINIFLSEGAGIDMIINKLEKSGHKINRDAFGHIRLDEINPGVWFSKQFGVRLKAEKILVQKSGYFARSAAPSTKDLNLIKNSVEVAVESAIQKINGVIGINEENDNILSCIAFDRIKGGKPFNVKLDWFQTLLKEIGQL